MNPLIKQITTQFAENRDVFLTKSDIVHLKLALVHTSTVFSDGIGTNSLVTKFNGWNVYLAA